MTCRIIGGNLRDLSYIASNLRPEDKAEVDCQLDEWTPAGLALGAMQGFAYVAVLDGNPEAAFGAAENRSGLWTIWCWGSKRVHRCVPRITRFCWDVLMPDVMARGALRGEARPLASNDLACRWLDRLGATRQGLLKSYGKNGEDFVLYEWVRSDFEPILFKKVENNVRIQNPEAAESAASPEGADA